MCPMSRNTESTEPCGSIKIRHEPENTATIRMGPALKILEDEDEREFRMDIARFICVDPPYGPVLVELLTHGFDTLRFLEHLSLL